MPKRIFFKDEENPYDLVGGTTPSVPKTEYRDEVKPIEGVVITPDDNIIHNFDEPSRRLDTGSTGTIKVGVETNTGGITNASISTDIVIWAGSTQSSRATAPFRVNAAGDLVATSATITGSITATTGTIGGFEIGVDYVRDIANSFGLASAATGGDDVRFWSGATFANRAIAPLRLMESGALVTTNITISGLQAGSSVDGQYMLANSIGSAAANLALRSWNQTCVFSSTDLNTVSWTAGSFVLSDGTTYAINAGNTGDMAARTYIYLDIAVSTTAYQITTTAATAVGNGKKMVASAINGAAEATFTVFGGVGGLNIDAASIVAGSITTNEIAANTIVAANIASLNMTSKSVTFDTGTMGGFEMGTDYIRDVADSFGLASAVTGGDDVRFWAGSTFANRATAPLRIAESGAITITSMTIGSATINSGVTITIADDEDKTGLIVNQNDITHNGNGINIINAGTGKGLYIDQNGAGCGLHIDQAGDNSGISITQSTAYSSIDINNTAVGSQSAVYIRSSGYSGTALMVKADSITSGKTFSFTSASTNTSFRYMGIIQNNSALATGTIPLQVSNIAMVETHFRQIMDLYVTTIFVSDGTTPNGNLTGIFGDVCFCCDGGKAYYCTASGKNWTAM